MVRTSFSKIWLEFPIYLILLHLLDGNLHRNSVLHLVVPIGIPSNYQCALVRIDFFKDTAAFSHTARSIPKSMEKGTEREPGEEETLDPRGLEHQEEAMEKIIDGSKPPTAAESGDGDDGSTIKKGDSGDEGGGEDTEPADEMSSSCATTRLSPSIAQTLMVPTAATASVVPRSRCCSSRPRAKRPGHSALPRLPSKSW